MIIWNHTLKIKYENLLVLDEIARLQCICMASCKRAALVQNYIKTKHINRMLTKNMENVFWVILKGLIEGCHEIINEAIGI